MTTKKLSLNEVEKVILDLDKQGLSSEKIGLVLKKEHGIKNFKEEFGKRIAQVTGKKDAELLNVRKKVETLQKHLEKNKKDQPAKKRLIAISARHKKIENYLSRRN